MAVYDLIFIGSGAAGTSAAVAAKHEGASRVAIVEQGPVWGTCINVGCIPSKFLLALAESAYYRNYDHPGIRIDSQFSLKDALAGKKEFIDSRLKQKYDHIVTTLGIEIIEGKASFESAHKLRVAGRLLTADRFVIATGSSPAIPPIDGITSVPYMTNVEALDPERIPSSLIVIGGRALGLEFAQMYTHLGAEVTILQRSSRILPENEPEIADLLAGYLTEEGIRILAGSEIHKAEQTGDRTIVAVTVRGKEERVSAERLLLATGRTPNSAALQPGKAGVKTGKNGEVIVDVTMRTSVPHIWAAGDVTGEPMLETAARYGGEIAGLNAFSELKRSFNRSTLPYGIFTTPGVAGMGMTVEQAKQAGLHPIARSTRMDAMAKSGIMGDIRGMVMLVADRATGRLLGMHICSPLATEIVHAGVLAIANNMTVDDIAGIYHVFPTVAEAISICARGLSRDISCS